MPISLKKRRANRHNARKSTGPKTAQGKAISRYNAVKHGLYSSGTIIITPRFSENLDEYQTLQNSINECLKPDGEIQERIAQQILYHFWLSHRFATARDSHYLSPQILIYWRSRLFKKIRKLTDWFYYLQEILVDKNENAVNAPSKIFRNEPNSWHYSDSHALTGKFFVASRNDKSPPEIRSDGRCPLGVGTFFGRRGRLPCTAGRKGKVAHSRASRGGVSIKYRISKRLYPVNL